MTWLSEVRIEAREAARLRLSDSYAWHRKVWEAFPGRKARDWLVRFDDKRGWFRLYIISGEKPEIPPWGSWRVREIGDDFLSHEHYRFELRANPTVKKAREGRKHGTRVGIYSRESLIDWLARKGEVSGFSIEPDSVQVSPPINQPFSRKGIRGNHKRVDFRGKLAITDRTKFAETFRKGIGSAKAFGFALLVLKPMKGGE